MSENTLSTMDTTTADTAALLSVNATVQPNTGADYQRLIYELADGYYRIKNEATGLYLTAESTDNGANVLFRRKITSDNQRWREIKKAVKHADYTLFSPVSDSSKFLSVENNGADGSTNLKLWESLNNTKQYFWPRKESSGDWIIVHTYSGKCISAKN